MNLKIKDGSFMAQGGKSATLGGDRLHEENHYIKWSPDKGDHDLTVFTDICLHEALSDKSRYKVAWLIEPPCISNNHWEFLDNNPNLFDLILTWRLSTIKKFSQAAFVPFGGSWIKDEDWWSYEKSKDFCIFVSEKKKCPGHQLRHEVVKKFDIDVYGSNNPVKSKLDVLQHYKYCIVVENCKEKYWFTEKLIDPLCVGCTVFYWGCPGIDAFFDGVYAWDTLEDLGKLIGAASLLPPPSNNWGKGEYKIAEKHVKSHIQDFLTRLLDKKILI